MSLPAHGANPQHLYKSLQMTKPEESIDFSMNVNPLGLPTSFLTKWDKLIQYVTNYPDPDNEDLSNLLAEINGLAKEEVLVGNGGAELIFLVGQYLTKKRLVIVQPAFAEYEIAANNNHCQVFYFKLSGPDWDLSSEELLQYIQEVQAEAVFLCTPNNPTGISYSQQEILRLISENDKSGVLTIIDEAFYDFASPPITYAQEIKKYQNLIILRSLTKMYAIAGLRLGFLLAREDLVAALRKIKPHWSVNGIANQAGLICLQEAGFVEKTRGLIESEGEKIFRFLLENNFNYSNSTVNFFILQDPELQSQEALLKFLMKKAIVPRHTNNFPGLDGKWIRLAIKTEAENKRLLEVLREWRTRT